MLSLSWPSQSCDQKCNKHLSYSLQLSYQMSQNKHGALLLELNCLAGLRGKAIWGQDLCHSRTPRKKHVLYLFIYSTFRSIVIIYIMLSTCSINILCKVPDFCPFPGGDVEVQPAPRPFRTAIRTNALWLLTATKMRPNQPPSRCLTLRTAAPKRRKGDISPRPPRTAAGDRSHDELTCLVLQIL